MEYIVRQGDTVSALAARFNISQADLLAQNPFIENPDLIFAGTSLRIAEPPVGDENGIHQPLLPTGGVNTGPTPRQPDSTTQIAWGAKVSAAFKNKAIEIAELIAFDTDYLMAAMAFESAETFSPSIRNAAGSGAVGLIQFMPATASALGASIAELASMSAVEQLGYVEAYFRPYCNRLSTLEDVYMAILMPAAIGKPDSEVLFQRGTKAYAENAGLDADGDGVITKREAAAAVRTKLIKGSQPGFIG